ncbi:MAG: hypothetical protein R3326_00490 [Gemmatimonadota bacterium]|nr:hypothetical protein [Gemmatimonadota bacterium]
MMGGRRTPPWLVVGALAMLFAFAWFLFAPLLPGVVWIVAAALALIGAILLLVRAGRDADGPATREPGG